MRVKDGVAPQCLGMMLLLVEIMNSISINNAYGSTTTTNTVATAASFYSIWAGGVKYSPLKSKPYSYFGSVKLTVGNIITQWKTWTTDGTICGWISTTDITQELKTASNYSSVNYSNLL